MTLSLQEMSDRFEIQDLLVGYCYAVDNQDFDAFAKVFHGRCRDRLFRDGGA